MIPLLDAFSRIGGLRGRPRNRPKRFADRGYDFDKYRRLLWKRGIKPLIARRGVAHRSDLGKTRWVVERTFAWLHQFKRLRIRYERDGSAEGLYSTPSLTSVVPDQASIAAMAVSCLVTRIGSEDPLPYEVYKRRAGWRCASPRTGCGTRCPRRD